MSETWLQLTLAAGHHDPETLEDVLLAAGALAVTLSDGGDQPVLEPLPGQTPLWSQTLVTGLFAADTDLDALRQALQRQLGAAVFANDCIEQLPERDWERAWLDDFQAMRFGRRLWVCPSTQAPPDPTAVNLILDPGLAFGTGTHPTTALCLRWLDGADAVIQDQSVIDYGCGSGILAVAAAKLGAQAVYAVDIDPQALLATTENAARNGVAASIRVMPPEQLPQQPVALLLANILAGPLIELAPCFAALVQPDGQLVMSGLLHNQTEAVAAAYATWFGFEPVIYDAEWALLHATRNNNVPAPIG